MAIIIIRTLVVYFALVISMRLMGKRQLSELELPELAIDKNTEEQIAMCFEAYHSKNWKTYLD